MKRITDINQLKKGNIIVSVAANREMWREFLCIHLYDDKYSPFLDELQNEWVVFMHKV